MSLPIFSTRRFRRVLAGVDLRLVAGLSLVALAAMWRYHPLGTAIRADNQIYFFVSERAASGIPPHVSELDPKNSLCMLMTALAIAGGRLFGIDDLMSTRVLSMAITAAVFPLLWTITRRLGANRWMAASTVTIPLLFPEYLLLTVLGACPKVFLVFFEVIWMLAATFDAPFFLGAVTGACFLVWQPSLLLLVAAIASAFVRDSGRIRAVLFILAGLATSIAVYEAYFFWHGALHEQLYQSLVFPTLYRRAPRSMVRLFFSIFQLTHGFEVKSAILCVFGLTVAVSWVLCLVARWRTWMTGRPERICLLLAATGTLVFSFIDYQGYPDRLFFLPFLFVMNGVVFGALIGAIADRAAAACSRRWPNVGLLNADRAWRMAGAVVLPVAAASFLLAARTDRSKQADTLKGQREAAAYVGLLAKRGNSVYAMGPLHLLAMNHMSNFNHFGFFPVRVTAHLTERMNNGEKLLPLRNGELPDILLCSRMPAPGSNAWIRRFYRPMGSAVLARERVKAWRLRKDAKPPKDATPM